MVPLICSSSIVGKVSGTGMFSLTYSLRVDGGTFHSTSSSNVVGEQWSNGRLTEGNCR